MSTLINHVDSILPFWVQGLVILGTITGYALDLREELRTKRQQ